VVCTPVVSPTVSVIIPRKAEASAEEVVQAVLVSEYPRHLLEVIEVVGNAPSQQRNLGAHAAHGDILYFLDNDSMVTPSLFARVMQDYIDPPPHLGPSDHLAGVGGPNLTPPTDGLLQRTFGYALASPFAHFTMCARYKSTGKARVASEKELILCNLSVKREVFLREGGFNEALYPNEENEFMNRLAARGYHFIYDPDAYVYRSRRKHVRDFIKQLFHYGRGRAEQMLVEGLSWRSLLFFLPSGMLMYGLGMLGMGLAGYHVWWLYLPATLYGVLALFSAFQDAIRERHPGLMLLLPVWYLVMHLAYGVGLLHGFWKACRPGSEETQQPSPAVEVIVRKTLGHQQM